MQALEEDKRAMEQQLQVVAGDAEKLREKEVMWAMKMMMEEEMAKKATLKRHEERQGVIRSALTRSAVSLARSEGVSEEVRLLDLP